MNGVAVQVTAETRSAKRVRRVMQNMVQEHTAHPPAFMLATDF